MPELGGMSEIEKADETAILRILKIIRHAQDFANTDELYHNIVNSICDIYKRYYHVSIFLVDPKQQVLRLSAIAGEGAAEQRRLFPDGYAHSFTTGITGQVYSTGRMYLCNDLTNDPHFVDIMSPKARSELCMPIRDGNRTIGMLNIESDQVGSFTATDVYLFEVLTAVLGNSIRRDRVQRELRETLGALGALAAAERLPICILNPDGEVVFGNTRFAPYRRLDGLPASLSGLRGGDCIERTFTRDDGSEVTLTAEVLAVRGGYIVARFTPGA